MGFSRIDVFHADSLAGPMKALKEAFEAGNREISVHLTSGRSQELAERILNGESCDVFVPSTPAVIDEALAYRKVKGTGQEAAAWSVVFSANEMVLITARGNPRRIGKMVDLAREDIRFTRVSGEKDLATRRCIEFIRKAAAQEGHPEQAQRIIDKAAVDPVAPRTVPMTVAEVVTGSADAGIVYCSAAVAQRDKLEILRFPARVNLSDDIRNAATVPATAKAPVAALAFIRFILSEEGKAILLSSGQPPISPPLFSGSVPPELGQPLP
jgi:ABC-type molybdate transport system substrate-binding protein